MSINLLLQSKCSDGNYIPCYYDSNNNIICTCANISSFTHVQLKGNSNEFTFEKNGSPCTLINDNVVCNNDTFTFGKYGAIHSSNRGKQNNVCIGVTESDNVYKLTSIIKESDNKNVECPTSTHNIFVNTKNISNLSLQTKCTDGNNIPCYYDSNNNIICTCTKTSSLTPVQLKGTSNEFTFNKNGFPCTLINDNVVCNNDTFTFDKYGAIQSSNRGKQNNVCLGVTEKDNDYTITPMTNDNNIECPTTSNDIFVNTFTSPVINNQAETKNQAETNNQPLTTCPIYKGNDNLGPYLYDKENEKCLLKSLVSYHNSDVDKDSFTSNSFNVNPVYDYVLSKGDKCSSGNISCGFGTVCINGTCVPYDNGTTCPKYVDNPNMGSASYQFFNGMCQYPTPTIQSGNKSNYVFNWGYGQGYPCGGDNECEPGMTCESGYCTPPSNQMEWYARQNNGTTCTHNNQCISGLCSANICAKIDPESYGGKCPANNTLDPAYDYMKISPGIGCVAKSIISYSNSTDFSTSSKFNTNPRYEYVLPQYYEGCDKQKLSCPNGQICNNGNCADFSSGWKQVNGTCPVLGPNPVNYGNATYEACGDGTCNYPDPVVNNGGSNNYNFNWEYADSCPCNKDAYKCKSGSCDTGNNRCERS